MAEKKLFDNNDLGYLLDALKEKFALVSALATINGLSLVNGGDDIVIEPAKDVLFFEGMTTKAASEVKASSTAAPTAIWWNTATSTFGAVSNTARITGGNAVGDLYNNWNKTGLIEHPDDWGTAATTGRTPVQGKLYIDKQTKKFYRWDGTNLVDLTIDTTLYEVVSQLPTASVSTMNKIYIVPSSGSTATNNVKTEYITYLDGSTYKWEKIGEVGADINLSNYVSTASLATTLSSYYTKSQADSTFLKQTTAESTYMKVSDYGYTTMTEAEIKAAVTAKLG